MITLQLSVACMGVMLQLYIITVRCTAYAKPQLYHIGDNLDQCISLYYMT